MRTYIGKLKGGLVLAAVLTMAQAASAFYDANLGRWLNRDPLRERGGLNLYRFCKNSPVTDTDPFGLSPCTDKCSEKFFDNLEDTKNLQLKVGAWCLGAGAASGVRVTTVPPPWRITGYSAKDGAIAGGVLAAGGMLLTGAVGTVGSSASYATCMAGCLAESAPPPPAPPIEYGH